MARPRSDIGPRVLRAARARFLLEGVDGASLRQIAADAGTSIGMVYYYYPTKDDLFSAVVEEPYAAFVRDLEGALAPGVPSSERLRRLYARVAEMTDDELTVLRLVVREALVSSTRLSRIVERVSHGHVPLMLQALLEGTAAGEITDRHHPAVLVVSTFALAVVPQVVRRLLGGKLPAGFEVPSADELARSLHAVLLHGIATERPEGAPPAAPSPGPPAKKRRPPAR